MRTVTLTVQEWNQVLAILSNAPWREVNPLLMRIGEQLNVSTVPPAPADVQPAKIDGNSHDTH